MGFSSPPAVVSIAGEAILVRHIYLPDLGKSFSVWTADIGFGNTCFLYREADPINFSGAVLFDDKVLQVPSKIKSFSIIEFGDPNNVVFAWGDGTYVWSMMVNFSTNIITASPNKEFMGKLPTLSKHTNYFRVSYVSESDLKSRIGFAGSEVQIADVSGYSILENDNDIITDHILKYVATYGPNNEIARQFIIDANTSVLVDCEYSELTLDAPTLQETQQNIIGRLGQNVLTGLSLPGGGEYFKFTTPLSSPGIYFDQSPPIITWGTSSVGISIWAKVDTTIAITTTLIYGTDSSGNRSFCIYLPFSDGNIYFDLGNSGGTYDRINKAASVFEYADTLTNWIFYKNTATGLMHIYRDGVLWHSGTSKVLSLNNLHSFSIASNWPGNIASVAIIKPFNIESEPSDQLLLFNFGPNGAGNFSSTGRLAYNWTFNDYVLSDKLTDLSGNNIELKLRGLSYRSIGVQFDGITPARTQNIPIGSAFTIEAWITPTAPRDRAYAIYHDDLVFGYDNTGKLFFEFAYGGDIIKFHQLFGRILDYNRKNYISISHTFGEVVPQTFMMINGSVVQAFWINGNGKEAAVINTLDNPVVNLNAGSRLHGLRISNVAKSKATLLAYLEGRS